MKPTIHSRIDASGARAEAANGVSAMAASPGPDHIGRLRLFWPARPDPKPFFDGFAALRRHAVFTHARQEIVCSHRGTGEAVDYRSHWSLDRFEWIRFALIAPGDDAPVLGLRLDLDGANRPRRAADSGSLTIIRGQVMKLRRQIGALIDLSMTGRPAGYPTDRLIGDLVDAIVAETVAL